MPQKVSASFLIVLALGGAAAPCSSAQGEPDYSRSLVRISTSGVPDGATGIVIATSPEGTAWILTSSQLFAEVVAARRRGLQPDMVVARIDAVGAEVPSINVLNRNVVIGPAAGLLDDVALLRVSVAAAHTRWVALPILRSAGAGYTQVLLSISVDGALEGVPVRILTYDGIGERGYLPMRRPTGLSETRIAGAVVTMSTHGASKPSVFGMVVGTSQLDASLLYVLPLSRLDAFVAVAMQPIAPTFLAALDGTLTIGPRSIQARSSPIPLSCGVIRSEIAIPIALNDDDSVVDAKAVVVPGTSEVVGSASVRRIVPGRVDVAFELVGQPRSSSRTINGPFGAVLIPEPPNCANVGTALIEVTVVAQRKPR